MKRVFVLFVFAAALATSKPALAGSFTLNQSGCCGVGPFGSVTLSQVDLDTVDVLVDLNDGIGFVDSGSAPPGNHPSFAWNLFGAPAGVSVSVVQNGGDGWTFYDQHLAPVTMSNSYGTYQFALYCNFGPSCGPGASHPNFGPLEFHVTLAGITENSFVANAAGSIFVADIASNGITGLVRATTSDRTLTEVPEPATLTLVGFGLFGVATRARRKVR